MSDELDQTVENPSWSHFEQWNELFEELCRRRGFAAANDLAQVYCRRTRRQTRRDLDATVRNINNWRSGSHAPSARNLAILGQLLDVTSDPSLDKAWHTLYRRTKREPGSVATTAEIASSHSSRISAIFRGQWRKVLAIAAVSVTAALVGGLSAWEGGSPSPATASAPSQHLISFRRTIVLSLGESTIIHGHRGDCGAPPPDKATTTAMLPTDLGIGVLSAGNVGTRYSRHCGGLTPAREVILRAERVGSAKIELFDDVITVAVVE